MREAAAPVKKLRRFPRRGNQKGQPLKYIIMCGSVLQGVA